MYNPYIQITIVLSSIFLYHLCLGLDAEPLALMGGTSNMDKDYQQRRQGRTLINQFPFNQGSLAQLHGGNHGGNHGAHHGHGNHGTNGFHNGFPQLHQGFSNAGRFSRQGAANGNGIEDAPVDLGTVAAAGERCVEKVMMVEETQYDDSIECHHSYDKRCHTTYTTDYVPQQVEDCDENFIKECYIEYEDKAFSESVQICNERPVRDCQGRAGPIECETVYETECSTAYHLHEVEEDSPNCRIQMMEKCREVTQGYSTKEECDKWPQQVCELEKKVVKKYSPETQCRQLPRELCGPGACPIRAGPKECRNEMKTIVQEVPREKCSLRAQPYCEFETKLVPVLKPVENCVDVPKEVCVRMRTNPRKVKRPVIKKWCYVPTEESGLDTEESNQNENNADNTNDETDDNVETSTDREDENVENPDADSVEANEEEATETTIPLTVTEESSSSDENTTDNDNDDTIPSGSEGRRKFSAGTQGRRKSSRPVKRRTG